MRRIVWMLLLVTLFNGYSVEVMADMLTIGEHGGLPVMVYTNSYHPDVYQASEIITLFFNERGFATHQMMHTAFDRSETAASVIAIEVADNARVAASAGIGLGGLSGSRPESYVLAASVYEGRPIISIVGSTARGARAGAVQLLSKLRHWNGKVTIQADHNLRVPFFRGREATLTPTGRILQNRPECMKEHNYEHWEKDRLVKLVDYVRACGFNSLQIMELLAYRDGTERSVVAPVIHTLANASRARGLSVSQYIWGSCDGFHWHDPETRPLREARYRDLATTYGSYVDHIITHWIDEGYEGGHIIPQEATTFLWHEYRKYNPDVRATFDTWGNDERSNSVEPGEGFWDARTQPGFFDSTYSPLNIGIALERWYISDKAIQVIETGRPLGIWGWYLGDYEMEFASHLELRLLHKYFSSLPDEAAGHVDWISIERCFHGLPADINWYVAGQKMWEPHRPLEEILMDFCGAVFGPEYADTMCFVFQTVDAGEKDYKYYGYFIPEDDRFPHVHDTDEFREQVNKALEAIKQVQLPENWAPNFPTIAPPEKYIESLRMSLEAFSRGEYPVF